MSHPVGGVPDGRPFVQRERAALADLFRTVGPDAPTLCAGWTTRDLLAHLVLRGGHPSAIGITITPLAGWTARQQAHIAAAPYDSVMARFGQGPARLSPMRLPGLDAGLNTFEFFVHHEDVLRAKADWHPRELAEPDQLTLWRPLTSRVRLYIRNPPSAVTLAAPGFGATVVGDATDASAITVTGAPAELVLYVHGRRDHAAVVIDGPAESRRRWERHPLGI